mmetsp:Transcript_24957/g.70279  ORF Transcript_24957/g.70279 Transcript_24957/m.70279 type:complete len:455 (+) Transcript_24957:91-1455(+)
MPLIHIYLKEGKDKAYLKGLGDGLHETFTETWGIPAKDRFHIFHQKSLDDLQIDRTMWDVERSDDCVVFHVFSSPRTKQMKLAFYQRLPAVLQERIGLRPEDVFISIFTNAREDWSFGNGRPQLLDVKPGAAKGTKRPREDSLPVSWQVSLNYGEVPPPGKRNGRYIDKSGDKGDCVDNDRHVKTTMHNARSLGDPGSLETTGFELRDWPSAVQDFQNSAEVEHAYYEEMRALIKKASGADRVLIFDHTLRHSDNKNLNVSKGADSAAPVLRVHCDYTAQSAPRRLMQFAKTGVYSHIRKRTLNEEDIKDLASRRFAFINVWRSIADEPVEKKPLAVCDTRSVPEKDQFLYELIFPDRVGENYSLKHSEDHKWHYFPRMTKDECLIFKVYDKKEDGPRFCFHTAFDDPLTTPSSPARQSIEIRSIAFFDDTEVDDSNVTSPAAREGVEGSSAHD